MKDKSKRLTVVNTENKKPQTSEVIKQVVAPASSSSHALGFNPNLYLLKSVWDSVFEIKTDVSGQKYIFGKLPVVTKYGITMYADDGNVDIPQLAEGLPFDQRTIWFNPDTKQIEVIGGTGGGEGGVSNFWDLSGIPSWITNTKPVYNYSEIQNTPDLSGYATTSSLNAVSTKLNDFLEGSDTDTVINKWKELETFLSGLTESDNLATILTGKADKSYVDTNFVTIAGTEDVTGLHNFVNGLKIGGLPITKKQDDVVYLDANLVVRGGITMYGDGEGGSSVPSYSTLGSLLNVDESNDAVASVDRVLFQSAGSNVWSWKALSEIGGGSSGGSVSGDYLPLTGGKISSSTSAYPFQVNTTKNTQEAGIVIRNNDNPVTQVGWYNTNGSRLYDYDSQSQLRIYKGVSYFNDSVLIHEGNYSNYALPLSGGTIKGLLSIRRDTSLIHFGNSGTINYGYLGFSGVDNPVVYMNNGTTNYNLLHSGNISSYNAGSATKLQTARTIWGQSFDGTGNVDGALTVKQTTQYASIKINSIHSTTQSFITFQANGVDKGNVGWTNGNGTHLYNATSLKTLELTNDGKLTYGESAAGDEVWHAGNSNNSTLDWNVNSLIAWCGGTTRQLVISKKSYTWGGSADTFPLIGLTASYDNNAYTMIAMPHIPFLKKGARGYNGDDFGAIIRFEGDASRTAKVWDVGCVSTSANNFFIQCDEKNIASFGNNGLAAIYTPNQWLSNSMLILGRADASTMTTYYAQIGVTDGNLHIDAYKGKEIYLNHYQGTGTSTRILANGSILTSGGVTMYSDIRKKTILNHVELSLKQIADAPLIEHFYNSDQEKTTHVGSIAQYWASLNDWFCKLDNEGFYTMEIQNAALASAISIARHLEKYESKTDKKIRQLKKRISQLEDELELLKKGV